MKGSQICLEEVSIPEEKAPLGYLPVKFRILNGIKREQCLREFHKKSRLRSSPTLCPQTLFSYEISLFIGTNSLLSLPQQTLSYKFTHLLLDPATFQQNKKAWESEKVTNGQSVKR